MEFKFLTLQNVLLLNFFKNKKQPYKHKCQNEFDFYTAIVTSFLCCCYVEIKTFFNCPITWNEAILPDIYLQEILRRLIRENFSHIKEKSWTDKPGLRAVGGGTDFNMIFVNICSHSFASKVSLHEPVSEFSRRDCLNI